MPNFNKKVRFNPESDLKYVPFHPNNPYPFPTDYLPFYLPLYQRSLMLCPVLL